MSSWPFLFAAALAIWLLLKGPAAKTPLFVQIVCRIAIVFFAYCGVLYLLKWDPFWKWMLSLGFENRNTAEGFLILVSTIVWLVATLRIICFAVSDSALSVLAPLSQRVASRDKKRLDPAFTLKNIAIFHYFSISSPASN